MYYINREQIDLRLHFLAEWYRAYEAVKRDWIPGVSEFAQERLLQLAIEVVTDVGSYLIDGFMMRDASSYEDIIEVLRGEEVFDVETAGVLTRLVSLRKPLMQTYWDFPREGLHPMLVGLDGVLRRFDDSVRAFLAKPI